MAHIRKTRLVRQNLALFAGGLTAGVGSFVYHAIAGRTLGPVAYGHLAFLVAAYAVGTSFAVVVSLVVARHTAMLRVREEGNSVRSILEQMISLVGIAGLLALLGITLLTRSVVEFEHLDSFVPVSFLGLCIAFSWQVAVPRGILQGTQRFGSLALNLALEPIIRVCALTTLLLAGYAVSGAMAAILLGLAFCLVLGHYSLRDRLARVRTSLHSSGTMVFSMTAAGGVIGVQLLFNQDVILAEHYLPSHDGGIYGALNKIGTILYYLTLSVSQVLFPRVVDAIAVGQSPKRLLLSSVGILCALASCALVSFAIAPGIVVAVLYGTGFNDARPFVLVMGIIGLALALNNLLVQFLMAMGDRRFLAILGAGCLAETGLIILFHANVEEVIADVVGSLLGLLVLLSLRSYFIAPTLGASTGTPPTIA